MTTASASGATPTGLTGADNAVAFTCGPWEALKGAEQADDMRCAVTAVRGDYRYLVATIENGAPGDFCDTELANAHLIAAAPELFEATGQLLGIIDEGVSCNISDKELRDAHPEDRDFIKRTRQAVAKAHAALTKARGEQS